MKNNDEHSELEAMGEPLIELSRFNTAISLRA